MKKQFLNVDVACHHLVKVLGYLFIVLLVQKVPAAGDPGFVLEALGGKSSGNKDIDQSVALNLVILRIKPDLPYNCLQLIYSKPLRPDLLLCRVYRRRRISEI